MSGYRELYNAARDLRKLNDGNAITSRSLEGYPKLSNAMHKLESALSEDNVEAVEELIASSAQFLVMFQRHQATFLFGHVEATNPFIRWKAALAALAVPAVEREEGKE